jgi:hypothetical protein
MKKYSSKNDKECFDVNAAIDKHCLLVKLFAGVIAGKLPCFLHTWLTSCGQKLGFQPITGALACELNVRAALIDQGQVTCSWID